MQRKLLRASICYSLFSLVGFNPQESLAQENIIQNSEGPKRRLCSVVPVASSTRPSLVDDTLQGLGNQVKSLVRAERAARQEAAEDGVVISFVKKSARIMGIVGAGVWGIPVFLYDILKSLVVGVSEDYVK